MVSAGASWRLALLDPLPWKAVYDWEQRSVIAGVLDVKAHHLGEEVLRTVQGGQAQLVAAIPEGRNPQSRPERRPSEQ